MRELSTVDTDSLEVIFSTHRLSFIRAAEKITGSRSHAEDIVHDAFLKILDTNSVNSIGSRTRYLMKMVRNLAIDHYRRKTLELRVFTHREDQATFVSETASPDNITIHRQALQTVAAALAELPERTRYAFEMHRIQGLSQKEIAIALGVSPTLVNFMIRDALVHCRKKLQGSEDNAP